MSRSVQKLSSDVATLLLPPKSSAATKRGLANSFQDVLKQSRPATKQPPAEKPASPKTDANPKSDEAQDNQSTETNDTDSAKKSAETDKLAATDSSPKVKTKKPHDDEVSANDDTQDPDENAQLLAAAEQIAQGIQKSPEQIQTDENEGNPSSDAPVVKATLPNTTTEKPVESDKAEATAQSNANATKLDLPDDETANSGSGEDGQAPSKRDEPAKAEAATPEQSQVSFKEPTAKQISPDSGIQRADKPVESDAKPAIQLQKPSEKKELKVAPAHEEQEINSKAAQVASVDSTHSAATASSQAAQLLSQTQNAPQPAHSVQPHPAAASTQLPPQPASVSSQDFAATNRDKIVTSMRSQLLPNGGTMRIQLDPPQLGSMEITVRMIDGAMTASFQTSSDQATQVLSHSLGQLKQALETQGISVEKLHVEQTPKDQQAGTNGEDREQRQSAGQDSQAQRDQQRREILERMWRKLQYGNDPLDMVA